MATPLIWNVIFHKQLYSCWLRSFLGNVLEIVSFGLQYQWEMLCAQSWPTLCDPVDCSLPGSSVHGIFQARILDWVAIPFSRGSSWLRDWTQVSWIAGRFLAAESSGKPCSIINHPKYLKDWKSKNYIYQSPLTLIFQMWYRFCQLDILRGDMESKREIVDILFSSLWA